MNIAVIEIPYDRFKLCERICSMAERLAYNIVGIFSPDLNEQLTTFRDHPVRSFDDINKFSWDAAVLACDIENFNGIVPYMVELNIGTREQFKNYLWLLQQFMTLKYEDCADPVIQETLEYWKTHELSVFNQHVDFSTGTFDRVFFDEELPYIYFKTVVGDYRKMYFPPDKNFYVYNGERFVEQLMKEQEPTSPHLYTTDEHRVQEGDILIDAGVCEGNFALRYADICDKIYLFEPEVKWHEPLLRTFAPFGDKVELIPRYVSDFNAADKVTTIDDALPDLRGKNIFLKMDVEGAEPDALRGAKRILTNNRVRASVCTYHNADDLVKVKSILRQYGYQTSVSDGYMVFSNSNYDILETADFRKGIVRARN